MQKESGRKKQAALKL